MFTILPTFALVYLSKFFFVYSVIFYRMELHEASRYSYQIFEEVSDVYAKKITRSK